MSGGFRFPQGLPRPLLHVGTLPASELPGSGAASPAAPIINATSASQAAGRISGAASQAAPSNWANTSLVLPGGGGSMQDPLARGAASPAAPGGYARRPSAPAQNLPAGAMHVVRFLTARLEYLEITKRHSGQVPKEDEQKLLGQFVKEVVKHKLTQFEGGLALLHVVERADVSQSLRRQLVLVIQKRFSSGEARPSSSAAAIAEASPSDSAIASSLPPRPRQVAAEALRLGGDTSGWPAIASIAAEALPSGRPANPGNDTHSSRSSVAAASPSDGGSHPAPAMALLSGSHSDEEESGKQSHSYFKSYLTEAEWAKLLDPNVDVAAKIDLLVSRCLLIFLHHPGEKTMAWVMGFAFAADNHSAVAPEVRYEHLQTFKEVLVKRRPTTRCDPELFVETYPASPANLPRILYEHAYGAAPPVACPLTPFLVNFLKTFVPCRASNASLRGAHGHVARGRPRLQPGVPTGPSRQASIAGPPHGAANPPSMGIIGMFCVEAAKQGVELSATQLSALAHSLHQTPRTEETLPGLEVFRGQGPTGSPPRQRPHLAAPFGQARLTIADSPRIGAATASVSSLPTPGAAASAASQGCRSQGAAPVASPGSGPATPRTVASDASQGCLLHDGRPAASPGSASATLTRTASSVSSQLTRAASSASSQGCFQDGNAPAASPGTAPALAGNAASRISPVNLFPTEPGDVTHPGVSPGPIVAHGSWAIMPPALVADPPGGSAGPIVAHGPPASQPPALIADPPGGSGDLPGFLGECRDMVAAAALKPKATAKPSAANRRRGAAKRPPPLAPPSVPPPPTQHIVRRRVRGKSAARSVVPALPGTSSAAAALILGCKRCRGSDNGCANSGKTKGCRDPAFKGERGPQAKQAKTA